MTPRGGHEAVLGRQGNDAREFGPEFGQRPTGPRQRVGPGSQLCEPDGSAPPFHPNHPRTDSETQSTSFFPASTGIFSTGVPTLVTTSVASPALCFAASRPERAYCRPFRDGRAVQTAAAARIGITKYRHSTG